MERGQQESINIQYKQPVFVMRDMMFGKYPCRAGLLLGSPLFGTGRVLSLCLPCLLA